jgi:hypothetical protein
MSESMKLLERLDVVRNMVWEVKTYQDLIEFLSYDLHDTPSRIDSNAGLYFIWRSLMALQILTLRKMINDDEPFSFQKLINIASASIKGFDKNLFQSENDLVVDEFKKNKLDFVRDKFVAHLDITSEEIGTDIHTLCITTNQVTSLFNRISTAIGRDEYMHDDCCLNGLKEIFSELDEYEKVKAIITVAQINGAHQISVADFLKVKD